MEIIINNAVMENYNQEERYLKAKEKVNKLKSFYIHLSVYIIINTVFLLFIYSGYGNKIDFWQLGSFFTPLGWGIGLAIHALIVFGPNLSFLRNWERKKVDQFIEEEQTNNNQWE